ncbi:60S ribosomal protein L6 [Capsicum annuum]|uniref:60S ribosomal protein L6 n=1 Tax=Capsicum annuum TaxID=4072 RepID=A0A2G2YM74_CAPAN|nr:60S ribosomal protein L6 [Capsicum annuum]
MEAATTTTVSVAEHNHIMWRMRLHSAIRTVVAYAIIGCSTLYGPPWFKKLAAFPAFSYVTATLVTSDSTLGDTLSGCWHAIIATVQTMPLSMLSLWIATAPNGSNRLFPVVSALALALSSLLVAVVECTDIRCKKIAFGQLVLVFADGVIRGVHTSAVVHPLRVAYSTVLGMVASLLALLLPYPRLAYFEGRRVVFFKQLVGSGLLLVSGTLKVNGVSLRRVNQAYVIATSTKVDVSGVNVDKIDDKYFAKEVKKKEKKDDQKAVDAALLKAIEPVPELKVRKLHQLYAENSKERVEIYSRAITSQDNLIAVERLSKAKFLAQTAAKLLQSAKLLKGGLMWETPWIRFFKSCSEIPGENGIQNMELSIRGMEISLTSCPSFSTGLVKEELKDTLIHMSEQIRRKSDQVTHQETNGSDFANKSIFLHDDTMSPTQTSLPAFFFLFCAKMLLDNSSTSYNEDTQRLCHKSWMKIRPRKETLMFALKCSVSLGLAMWIGLLFDKQNGFWAGLTVASTLAQGKLATFTLANAQAQGIAFGSVYGVLGCSVFQKATNLRFLALLPWIIFSSFLKHSRISGHAGGISALLGAVMILGRKYSDPANEFAIIRLTETFIGLSCFIAVQFLLNPKRAASLARNQLYCTLDILKDCMNQIAQKDQRELRGLIEKQRKLKSHILNLQKLCLNAELEPDFWFLPFNATCYKKLQGSLSKIADLFYYVVYNINNMSHDFQSHAVDCKELHDSIYDELEYLKETTISLISTFLDKPSLMKLFPDDDDQEVKILHDLEEGKLSKKNDEKTERGLCFFLERSKEVIDGILSSQDKQELKGKTIISLYALEFCITSMLKVIKDIKMTMKELSQWESS